MLNQHSSVQSGDIQDTIHFSFYQLERGAQQGATPEVVILGTSLVSKSPGLDVVIVMVKNSISSFRDVWVNDRANSQLFQGAEKNVNKTEKKERMNRENL